MEQLPNFMKQMLNDRSLDMKQKLLTFMMLMPSKQLPDNPNMPDFHELGKKIKELLDNNVIKIEGFDKDFNIKVISC